MCIPGNQAVPTSLDIQACITERDRRDVCDASLPNTFGTALAPSAPRPGADRPVRLGLKAEGPRQRRCEIARVEIRGQLAGRPHGFAYGPIGVLRTLSPRCRPVKSMLRRRARSGRCVMSLPHVIAGHWRLASGEPPQVPDDLAGFQRPRRVGAGPHSQCLRGRGICNSIVYTQATHSIRQNRTSASRAGHARSRTDHPRYARP